MKDKKMTDYKRKNLPVVSNVKQNKFDKELYNMASAIVSRQMLGDRLGKSYYSTTGTGAKRDIYEALGYTKAPTFSDYYSRYRRQDIARRIVNAMPNATWRKKPAIVEIKEGRDLSESTDFETAWTELLKKRKVWNYLTRADKIMGIGEYGVIVLGYNDGLSSDQPLKNAAELLYMRPYTSASVEIKEWEEDAQEERFGMPKIYEVRISIKDTNMEHGKTIKFHHSRIIHMAEEQIDNDVYGTPRLESVLNRLQDLELVAGGSSEMFWRGAFPGLGLSLQEGAQFGDGQDYDDLEDEIQAYVHGLQRYLRTSGLDITQLSAQVADPSNHVDVLLTIISAAVNIPKRILLGSERGELASSQDERAWIERIGERRENFAEPVILRAFIDRNIACGVLPEPKEGYDVVWPPLVAKGEKEEMEVARLAMEALAKYVSAPGADVVLPVEMFLRKFLHLTDEEIKQAMEAMESIEEEEEEIGEEEIEEIEKE